MANRYKDKAPDYDLPRVGKRVDFSDDKIGPNFDVPRIASRIDNSDDSLVGPNMGKVNKAKPKKAGIKPLKDTSSQYWSPTGTGDIGSVSGEIGADMGKVNKGGYDASTGMKKGGFVHHSEHVKKHAAGFKHHQDHVKAMCGGGKAGRK